MEGFISLITFESPLHQAWFLGSMFLLLLSCSAVVMGYRQKFQYLSVLHAIVAIEAILMFIFRPGENEVFSVHCIWFNFLMATAYFFLTDSAGTKQPEEEPTPENDQADDA
jgi:hypothetical protein